MVQLRTAAHTLASLDLSLADILHRLGRMAARMPAAPFATCIYAVIDPERNSCVIAKAGHPPPVLAGPGGAPQVLDLPPGSGPGYPAPANLAQPAPQPASAVASQRRRQAALWAASPVGSQPRGQPAQSSSAPTRSRISWTAH
jgi:hypothetical protein